MSATLHTPYHQSGSPCTESATPVAQSPLCYVTSLLWIDSGSNVIIYLLTKYPHYRVVCLDKVSTQLTSQLRSGAGRAGVRLRS